MSRLALDPAPIGEEDVAPRFALMQYQIISDRVTEFQKEREVWIRHSIVATFGFFGWIAVYRDNVTMTFMLRSTELQVVYYLPILFNLGGALRFFFIQRDINRMVAYLMDMERGTLGLPDALCRGMAGRGIRDRHWHAPSICYWVFVLGLSLVIALMLSGQVLI